VRLQETLCSILSHCQREMWPKNWWRKQCEKNIESLECENKCHSESGCKFAMGVSGSSSSSSYLLPLTSQFTRVEGSTWGSLCQRWSRVNHVISWRGGTSGCLRGWACASSKRDMSGLLTRPMLGWDGRGEPLDMTKYILYI
jgi:hypothetical protein